MAKLFFRYGAMGSSKTANALMVEYNYRERGKKAILAKPKTDTRDGELTISSRIGLSRPCILVEELLKMSDDELKAYDCIIVDEAHRAGANTYQKILKYFRPKFLLGMTATPERTDGYDIFKDFK